jgi:hypothetical protein
MKNIAKGLFTAVLVVSAGGILLATLNYFQVFETDASGWTMDLGPSAIQRVHSGGGTLHLPASGGQYYAEIKNAHDAYANGYGEAGYSFYGGADSVYHGDFFQAIDVYINANWTPAGESS